MIDFMTNRPYIKTVSGRLQVYAPFNDGFRLAALDAGGKYRKRTQMWSFRRDQYPKVAAICNRFLGMKLKIKGEK